MLSFANILKKEKGNPKNIYKIYNAKEKIEYLRLFDGDFYLNHYPDLKNSNIDPLEHYIYFGWKERKNPSKKFDGNYYLRKYHDVRESETNPLIHYVLYGRDEGRFPNHQAEINSPQNITENLQGNIKNLENSISRLNKKLNLIESVLYDIINGSNKEKYCPICKKTFLAFLPFGVNPRHGAQCPNCGSLERHRGLFLFLNQNPEILNRKIRLLHFAPEPVFFKIFRESENIDYHPVDIDPEAYNIEEKVDMQDIPYEDSSFELIYNSHVLEHVPDDIKAMGELYRVVKHKSLGGLCITMAPVYNHLNETFENEEYNTPELREKYFGQHDHLRKYGLDFKDRLKSVGFDVEVVETDNLRPDEIYDYGRLESKLYLCTKSI
jgi:predicted SAM-dependent methyltransferase